MRRLFILATVAVALGSALSCSKYDDVMPPKSVSDNMPAEKLQVPSNARDVSWDKEGSLWELSYEV